MRLLDQIAQGSAALAVLTPEGRQTCLPGAGSLAEALKRCPLRYVLSDPVTSLAAEMCFDDSGLLSRSLDLLRLPAPSVWVEFDNLARHPVLARLGLAPSSVTHQKIGILVEGDGELLRRGVLRVAWEARGGGRPELCPIMAQFDLDQSDVGADEPPALSWRPNLPACAPLLRCLRLSVEPIWRDYYSSSCSGQRLDRALQASALPIFADAPMFFSVMLLTLARGALLSRETDLSKLNRARSRVGKPALLNHVELDMALLPTTPQYVTGPLRSRQTPRRHLVRGHFVRRAEKIFWRAPHLRGRVDRGQVATRSVTWRLS